MQYAPGFFMKDLERLVFHRLVCYLKCHSQESYPWNVNNFPKPILEAMKTHCSDWLQWGASQLTRSSFCLSSQWSHTGCSQQMIEYSCRSIPAKRGTALQETSVWGGPFSLAGTSLELCSHPRLFLPNLPSFPYGSLKLLLPCLSQAYPSINLLHI